MILLDLEVHDRRVKVHLGDGANGGADVVWSHRDVFCLGHDGDLFELGYASGIGDIGLQNVDCMGVDDVGEWKLGVKAFASGDRNADFASDFEEFADAFFGDGFFVEERTVLFEPVAEFDGVHHVKFGVGFDKNVDFFPDGRADGRDAGFGGRGSSFRDFVVVSLREGVELHGGVTHVDDDFSLFSVLFGSARIGVPAVGIDADFLSLGSSKQLVNRAVEDFAFEVPQRDVDPADGGHREPPAFAGGVVVHIGPDRFGVERVAVDDPLLDQVGGEELNRVVGLHRTGVSQAVQSRLIGVQLDNQPVAIGVMVFCRKLVELDSGNCGHHLLRRLMVMFFVSNASAKDTKRTDEQWLYFYQWWLR